MFKGKYSMQSHGWPGPAYVLCSGYRSALPQQHLSVKLFARGVDYLQEKALLETPTITLQEYLPGLCLHEKGPCCYHQNVECSTQVMQACSIGCCSVRLGCEANACGVFIRMLLAVYQFRSGRFV